MDLVSVLTFVILRENNYHCISKIVRKWHFLNKRSDLMETSFDILMLSCTDMISPYG